MEKQFVPYELAVKLKEFGFSFEYLGIWAVDYPYGKEWLKITNKIETIDDIPAPLWQQAFDWFRDKYGFDLFIKLITFIRGTQYYYVEISHPKYCWYETPKITGKSYEQARQACLEKLIELIEQK